MEEDIKHIEERLNEYHTNIFGNKFLVIYEKDIQAIENLITRYKQLEEENKELKNNYINPSKARISYYDTKKGTEIVIEGFIPKSLVKEKLEELDKEKLKYDNDLRIYTLRNTFDFQKEVLQELLREE